MISKKVVQEKMGFVISNPSYKNMESTVQLLRITISEDETKIDFGYQANEYKDGGWIDIDKNTFIRAKKMKETLLNKARSEREPTKYTLLKATNIPYGPEKHHFNSKLEWRYFSLYFPKLPDSTLTFDLIEKEFGNKDDFNFFDIRLDEEDRKSRIY